MIQRTEDKSNSGFIDGAEIETQANIQAIVSPGYETVIRLLMQCLYLTKLFDRFCERQKEWAVAQYKDEVCKVDGSKGQRMESDEREK